MHEGVAASVSAGGTKRKKLVNEVSVFFPGASNQCMLKKKEAKKVP